MTSLHHQVQQLRAQSTVKTLEALTVLGLGFFLNYSFPNVLFNFMYRNVEPTLALQEQARAIALGISTVTLAIPTIYFIYAMVGNLIREMKASKLEKEIAMMKDHDCDCDHHHDAWLDESPHMANEMVAVDTKSARKVAKAKKVSKRK